MNIIIVDTLGYFAYHIKYDVKNDIFLLAKRPHSIEVMETKITLILKLHGTTINTKDFSTVLFCVFIFKTVIFYTSTPVPSPSHPFTPPTFFPPYPPSTPQRM